MPQQDTVYVTPEQIIEFVLEEMEAGVFPTYYSNLVPSVFDIYLYADDLERVRPIEQRVREEAVMALSEKLSALNKRARPLMNLPNLPLGTSKKRVKRYEILDEWSVQFHENTDDDARENPLVIHSSFPFTPEPDDRIGTLTERVSKRRSDGQTVTTSTQRVTDGETQRATNVVYATLDYEDETGAHTYQMTKDLIKIGRGSPGHWVDLKLRSKKDISREHLQIRRDTASSRFFLKDISSLGTTVDGKLVPPSMERTNGEETDKNIEIPLANKARIGLAGVLFIDFKAARQR